MYIIHKKIFYSFFYLLCLLPNFNLFGEDTNQYIFNIESEKLENEFLTSFENEDIIEKQNTRTFYFTCSCLAPSSSNFCVGVNLIATVIRTEAKTGKSVTIAEKKEQSGNLAVSSFTCPKQIQMPVVDLSPPSPGSGCFIYRCIFQVENIVAEGDKNTAFGMFMGVGSSHNTITSGINYQTSHKPVPTIRRSTIVTNFPENF